MIERKPSAAAPRPWWLIALGVAAAFAFAIALFPASLLAPQFERLGLRAVGIAGSVWNASIDTLEWQGVRLGALRWQLRPLALLRGVAAADIALQRPDGNATGRVELRLDRSVRLSTIAIDLPLQAFSGLPLGVPQGWQGRLQAQIEELRIVERWPSEARGVITVTNLVAPPPRGAPVGSYRIVLPHPTVLGAAGELNAQVTDGEGPFSVDARLALSKDRSFVLEGMIGARGAVPPSMQRSLELLGPPDAEGRRPFSVAGSL